MTEETASDHEHGIHRLLAFSDAVVAIAVTLLALPLIDLGHVAAEGFDAFIAAAGLPLLGFVLSFLVIVRLWWSHHEMFAHVERWSPWLVRTMFLWLFSIVLLAGATAVTTAANPVEQPWTFAVYVAVVLLSVTMELVQCLQLRRHPELTDGHDHDSLRRLVATSMTILGLLVALVVGLLFPIVNYFAFFVLLLTGRAERFVVRRVEGRRR